MTLKIKKILKIFHIVPKNSSLMRSANIMYEASNLILYNITESNSDNNADKILTTIML
jgi:hypothetical protein